MFFTLSSISFLVLLAIVWSLIRSSNKISKNLPPSPPALPIIGHLHLLKKPIHQCFHDLSNKYGPILFLKLGSIPTVVVSSPSAIKECFTETDVVLANRPPFMFGKYLLYNYTGMAAANYGDHWRKLRRICAMEVFSANRLNMFRSARREEVNLLIRRLHRSSCLEGFAKVELRSLFMELNMNIIMRMVAGKQYFGEEVVDGVDRARRVQEILKEFWDCPASNLLSDLFPVLQCVDFDGFVKKLVRLSNKMDGFLQELVEEHRQSSGANTMISHLLALQESHPGYYSDEIIRGLILVMLIGGSETTTLTLEWAMANLVNHPKKKSKATLEVDTQVGQDHLANESDLPKLTYLKNIISETFRLYPVSPFHLANESDLPKLTYLKNIISETFRLYPVSPLLLPHYSSDHCTIGGYDVPPGTIVFANAWQVHRDPKYWNDPMSFKPERFEHGKPQGPKLVLPFGMGRRACPGEALAHKVLELTLANLMQCFEWESADGKPVDMGEKSDITLSKAEPLQVICKPRPFASQLLSQV